MVARLKYQVESVYSAKKKYTSDKPEKCVHVLKNIQKYKTYVDGHNVIKNNVFIKPD